MGAFMSLCFCVSTQLTGIFFLFPCRMLRDVEFFRSRVAKLDGANDVGAWLVGVVAAKEVVAATAAAAAAAAAPVMREA